MLLETQSILAITSPLFLLIGLGYLVFSLRWLPRESARVLSAYTVKFALPALLFTAVSQRDINELANLPFLAAYALGSLVPFGLVLVLARSRLRYNLRDVSVLALGASVSNSVLIGLPLVIGVLGTDGVRVVTQVVLLECLLMIPLSLALADFRSSSGESFFQALIRSMWVTVKNPIILGIGLGVVFSLMDLQVPAVAGELLSMLGRSAIPVALFAIGGLLVGISARDAQTEAMTVLPVKLLVHPLAVFAFLLLLSPGDPVLEVGGVILASLSMPAIYPILVDRYGWGPRAAAILLPTTVVAFASINAILWLLAEFPLFGT